MENFRYKRINEEIFTILIKIRKRNNDFFLLTIIKWLFFKILSKYIFTTILFDKETMNICIFVFIISQV